MLWQASQPPLEESKREFRKKGSSGEVPYLTPGTPISSAFSRSHPLSLFRKNKR